MGPALRFRLNKNLDKMMSLDFFDFKTAGVDFSRGITGPHPFFKKIKEIRPNRIKNRMISEYISRFYEIHNKELLATLRYSQKEWKKIKDDFYTEVNSIFKGYQWPKGKYICYLSIFNCNPRFLGDKTFQVFYKNKKDIRRIIVHELLHFMFYEYLTERFEVKIPERKKWIISEIFNTIILNQKEFRGIIWPAKEFGYPEHRNFIRALTKEWQKHKDVNIWLHGARRLV